MVDIMFDLAKQRIHHYPDKWGAIGLEIPEATKELRDIIEQWERDGKKSDLPAAVAKLEKRVSGIWCWDS